MSATLWAANADEIDDLIIWLDNHPDDVEPLSRDAVAQWLVELFAKRGNVPVLRRRSGRSGRCA